MGNTTQWILELVDKITSPMKSIISSSEQAADAVDGVGDSAEGSKDKLKGMSAIDLFAVKDGVQSLADELGKINEPGAAFNAGLKDLEAITGVTGDALDLMGDKARDTAKEFGGEASDQLKSYKGLLSKLGPEIAQDQEALELMGRNVATLSKTMENDAVGAMEALSGSALQFAKDAKDPAELAAIMTDQMNVMAASAKEGSAEVPLIAQSIKQAGNAAYQAKLTFVDTNVAIQALGKGTIYGSEAGIGLRNMLGKMAGIDVIPKAAVEKLEALGINYDIVSDKTLPFTSRLKELKKAQADATLIAQIFGTENQNAVNTILDNIEFQEELQQKITGTNTATEQANIVMSGYTETMSRVNAWFKDLAIGAFSVTSKITPFVDGAASAVVTFANLSNAGKGVKALFATLKTMPVIGSLVSAGSSIASGGFAMMSTAAKGLGVAIMNIPILGWIAAIAAALIGLGVYFYKTSETFRGVVFGVWEFIKTAFTGMGEFIMGVLEGIWDVIKGVFNPANWFDSDYDFTAGFEKIAGAAKKYGKELSDSFNEGRAEGIADFQAEKGKEGTAAAGVDIPSNELDLNKVSPQLTVNSLSKKPKGDTSELKGRGSASIKNITQKIDIKNVFTIAKDAAQADVEAIAEKVVMAINGKLQDALVTID